MHRRILLIDDEVAITMALKIRLAAQGYEVTTAGDGRTGLAAAEAYAPDVIVLDIRMPDMDGFEVCRRLKAHSVLSKIPVIFLSANVKDEAKAKAYEAGGAAFLQKPFQSSDVMETIESLFAPAV